MKSLLALFLIFLALHFNAFSLIFGSFFQNFAKGEKVFNSIVYDPWLNGFSYRKPITVNNTQNSNTLTDYQVLFTLDTASLISAGKMRSDCADIRFTDSDGTTKLNYWIESGCNTTSTKLWVKVPSIPASGSKTIYMYYGDPSATSESNANSVFNFYADTVSGCGSWSSCSPSNSYCKTCSNGWYAKSEDVYTGYDPNTNAVAGEDASDGNPSPCFRASTDDSYIASLWLYRTIALSSGNYALRFDFKADSSYNPGYQNRWFVWNGWGTPCDGGRQTGSCGSGELNTSNAIYDSGGLGAYAYWTQFSITGLSITSGNLTWGIRVHDGWNQQNFMYKVDNVIVRKYASPEPTTSVGSEDVLITQAGSPTSWEWKVPSNGDKVRSGSATSWQWKPFQDDGTGITVARGSATSWQWEP